MEDSEATQRGLAQGAQTSRHVRMMQTLVVEIFLINIFGGLQLRHNWPLSILDAGYLVAVSVAAYRWAVIYHPHEE